MSLLDALLLDPLRINVWFANRADGVAGTGTQNDPYDGSTAARLDAHLSLLTANTTVNFGPGTFQINGYQDGASSSWLKAGMKIVGSGIDVTTLQVVGASTANKHYFAIGHPFSSGGTPNLMDYVEVSDLTINCNLGGAGSQTACGAVRVMGNYARVRRTKVLNWGTKSSGPPCFVIAMITADPASGVSGVVGTGIEECIAIIPDSGNVGPANVLHAGPKDDAGTNAEGYGTGAFIRNCYLDSGWPAATAEVRGLSMAWCIGGVIEGNQVYNMKYGGPYISKSSSRDLVVRNNFYKNVAKGPFWNFATLTASSILVLVRDSDPTIAIASTSSAHGLLAGDRVKIDVSGGASYYEGIFVIKDVPSSTTFRYQMLGNPGGDASSPTMQKVFGVGKLAVEGNTIELATGSDGVVGIEIGDDSLSPRTPDYAHGDVIIRDNKVRYVDGLFDAGYTGYAIQVNGAKNLIVRNNVVEVAPDNPLRNIRCGSVSYFNNRTPSGVLIEGLNEDNSGKYSELETDTDFALVLGLYNRRC